MDTLNETTLIFEKVYKKSQSLLKSVGIHTEEDENRKRIILYRLYFYFNLLWGITDIVGQVALFFQCIRNGDNFTEVTNVTPCLLMCLVAVSQSIIFVNKKHVVRDLHKSILLQFQNPGEYKIVKTRMNIVSLVMNIITTIIAVGLTLFALTPFLKIIRQYYLNEKIYLTLPFLALYPFDTQIIFNWIISYIHLMWSAIFHILLYISPYFFCYTCTAAISCQFNFLCEDIKKHPNKSRGPEYANENLLQLTKIAKRHKELIRCIELLEELFSFSNLLHVVASSVLICLTAFNVMLFVKSLVSEGTSLVIVKFNNSQRQRFLAKTQTFSMQRMLNDIILALPFLQFLCLCLGQIFFICYYGDLAMRSSLQISDALYNCYWYNADKRIIKNILIMLIRSQKPCKFTAFGFSDINLNVYAKILSSSASYFTLLRTLYSK